ncbi:hypothetical protein PybrP1_007774 [[Pythium] brassicae (nom. inval.)]|nr:hypothetical protein PybrP1_007774 [[Pythium] brassicae (nom. inval.)]
MDGSRDLVYHLALNVALKGKIVLVRYDGEFSSMKAFATEQHSCGMYGVNHNTMDRMAYFENLLALVAFAVSSGTADARVMAKSDALPNWVGPKIGAPQDTACYRKTHVTKKCPPGFQFDKMAMCWAECPLEYPVRCAMECIPQNKDCTLQVMKKELFATMNKLVEFEKELREKFPTNTKSQLLVLLSKSDFAVYDLPVAVITCLGLQPPAVLEHTKPVTDMVKKIIEEVMKKHGSVLEPEVFLNTTSALGLDSSIDALDKKSMDTLKKLIDGGITCGSELKSIINRVVAAVKELKTKNPSSPVDMIRFGVSNSDIFLNDIPKATSNCIPKNAEGGFVTRENIRKTFQVIVDEIINVSSDKNGKPVSTASFVRTVADFGLDVVSNFDPTGLAALGKEFIQPICGPTAFLGEIDDGPADQALGLRTMGRAFASSSGTWKKKGSGKVEITFVSVDKFDVRVNVMSGGSKIAEVKVPMGKTVTWTKDIAELKDKTMYLDRWRPGLFGLPGTGGGSLLLWVPRSSEGGHLELRAQLNKILDQVMNKGKNLLDTSTFLSFTKEIGVGESVSALKSPDLSELTKLIESGVTCGTELKSIIDRIVAAVKQIKTTAPSSPVDVIRLALGNSDLFLKDIPAVTSSCIPKNAEGGFATRDDIRKTLQVIIDKVIDSSSNGGKPLSTADYALKITDMGLDAVAMFDPTGIAALAKEFIQPICGPTSFLGEVDDGPADQALGLRTVGKAFAGSSGSWKKAGDGILSLIFESTDKYDVRVNIFSGGNKITEVKVPKRKNVTWTKPLAELKDKTMYLDRWRPGFLGLPGTGGGSLLLWIPHSSQGGNLQLHTKINVS